MNRTEPTINGQVQAQVANEPAVPATRGLLQSRFGRLFVGREVWAVADQAMVSGTNFLTNVVLARLAGVEVFGAFALAWIVVLFANLFQTALIVSPMMSLRPKIEKITEAEYLGALLVHEGVFACVAAVIVQVVCHIAAVLSHKPELLRVGPALAVATFCYLAQDFIRRYLFTIRRSAAAFWTDVLSYPVQVVLIASIAKWHGIGTSGALWIVAATSGAGLLLAFFFLDAYTFQRQAVRSVARRHWGMSRWLTLSVVLDWISTNLFFIVAPFFFGLQAAGEVRAAQNLVGVTHIWFIGLGNIIPAETARVLHTDGYQAAWRYFRDINKKWGGFTALFLGVIAIKPAFILHLIYGPQYGQYEGLVRLYCLAYLLGFFGITLRAMLQALEDTKPIFWSTLTNAGLAILLAVPLVKWFGLNGVILGSIVTQILYCVIELGAILKRGSTISYALAAKTIQGEPSI